jgi:hypothetical protein
MPVTSKCSTNVGNGTKGNLSSCPEVASKPSNVSPHPLSDFQRFGDRKFREAIEEWVAEVELNEALESEIGHSEVPLDDALERNGLVDP